MAMSERVTLSTIWTIDSSGEPWLVDAWDEYSIDGNPSGWEEAIEKAQGDASDIRILELQADWDAVKAAFRPQSIAPREANDE